MWQVDAIFAIGRDVAGERGRALRALRSLAGERAVVTGVAAAGADRAVSHGVGREVRCRIGVAVAALNAGHRHVRRRLQTGRGGAVVAARAVGIGGRVGILPARPAGERRGRAGVAGNTVAAIGRDVARERGRALRALRTFAGERAVVTGVAPAGADRTVSHGVGREVRRRIGMAVAALNAGHRHMRRRLQTCRGGAVVTARAVGVGRRVGELPASPAGEG